LFFSNNPEKWIFLIALIAGCFFILALCFGLKAVSMEGESLIISNNGYALRSSEVSSPGPGSERRA
jgi:hypothetical protein